MIRTYFFRYFGADLIMYDAWLEVHCDCAVNWLDWLALELSWFVLVVAILLSKIIHRKR